MFWGHFSRSLRKSDVKTCITALNPDLFCLTFFTWWPEMSLTHIMVTMHRKWYLQMSETLSMPIRWLCLRLTRAPLGYFYNAPHWGGGAISSPPLISETTGPILKIQAAFESPGKTVKGKQILLTSGSRVTSQVRSKSKCSTFRAWWHQRAKLRC